MKRLMVMALCLVPLLCGSAGAQLAGQYTTYRKIKGDDNPAFTFNINADSPAFAAKGFEVVAQFNMLADMFIAAESAPIDRAQYDAGIELRRSFDTGFTDPLTVAYGGWHTSNGLGSSPSPTSVVADSSQSFNRQYLRAEIPYEIAGFRGMVGLTGWYLISAGTSEATAGLPDLIGWDDIGVVGSLTVEYTPEGDTKPTLLLGLDIQHNQIDAQLGMSVSSMVSRLFTVAGDGRWSRLYTLIGYQDGQYSRIGAWGDDVRAIDVGLAYNLID